jgi:hypothetical protein
MTTASVRQTAEEQLDKSLPLSVQQDIFGSYSESSQSLQAQLHRIQNLGVLVVQWAATIDNGEGADKGLGLGVVHHGPVGNLHVLIYEVDMYASLYQTGERESYPRALRHLILYGPSDREWDDGDYLSYHPPAELFRWRSAADAIVLFVYESDSEKVAPRITKRAHDPLFLGKVTRRETLLAPQTYQGPWKVMHDALRRAQERGAEPLLRELEQNQAWHGGWRQDMPKMCLRFATVPTWSALTRLEETSS